MHRFAKIAIAALLIVAGASGAQAHQGDCASRFRGRLDLASDTCRLCTRTCTRTCTGTPSSLERTGW